VLLLSNTTLGFEETTFGDWIYTEDWCSFCDKIYIRLEYDDKTRTTKCPKCGHTETYSEEDWKILQAQRYVCYRYMPGKYYFEELPIESIFRKYIRELNHEDWCSWLIHDYILARMRGNKVVQDKLRETATLVVERMGYDREPWNKLFEKMDANNIEIFNQVPQIVYEMVEKKFCSVTVDKKFHNIFNSYSHILASTYSYNRWKGDRVACWVAREINRICNEEKNTTHESFIDYYDYDPFLENYLSDVIEGKKKQLDLQETYIQWQLTLAEKFLERSNALVAIWDAYFALVAKLGIHTTWPPTNVAEFDANTVDNITKAIGEPILYELYDEVIELNYVDKKKACEFAKQFIEKIKEIIPNLTAENHKLKKALTYVS